jgi:hypothetical protein
MRNISLVSLLKTHRPEVKKLPIHQIAVGASYYAKCPKTKLDVAVMDCMAMCGDFKGFSFADKYISCRGKSQ